MKNTVLFSCAALAASVMLAGRAHAQTGPYKIVETVKTMGTGGIDYVYADSEGRRLYVPRGGNIFVYDLDTHKEVGMITNSGGHGVAVDPKSHHGFSSSGQITMFDTKTLEVIKKIPVQGGPDGIGFDSFSGKICIFSHRAPNVTLIDPADGTVSGTIDLGGAPEQAASDGKGTMYVDIEDKGQVAVVDMKKFTTTAHYELGDKGEGPAGLGLDAKNHILFAFCHSQNCVILNANDGKILATLPIGNGVDGGGFNPNTLEAFSSQRDGTLTIIKEKSPTSFEVEQNVTTMTGGKTCTLDMKKDQIVVITTERAPAPAGGAATTNAAAGGDQGGARRGGRGGGGPGNLDVIFVGK